jgi:hypothetical protein
MLQAHGTTVGGCASFEQRSPVSKERDRHAPLLEVITPWSCMDREPPSCMMTLALQVYG